MEKSGLLEYSWLSKEEFDSEKLLDIIQIKFFEDKEKEQFKILFSIDPGFKIMTIRQKIAIHAALCDIAKALFEEIQLLGFEGTKQ